LFGITNKPFCLEIAPSDPKKGKLPEKKELTAGIRSINRIGRSAALQKWLIGSRPSRFFSEPELA
jgi:hypothetical protein